MFELSGGALLARALRITDKALRLNENSKAREA